ncbi:MAG: N-formylglutamate amidohydrolase [Sphingomicrobium sp.]
MNRSNNCLQRPWWTVRHGPGAVVATAIHDGHDLRPEVAAAMALEDDGRLREEDPFTGQSVLDVPAHIIVHRSRFEFDLNRGPDDAVYETAEQSWGLKVWHDDRCDPALKRASLALHAEYYRSLAALLDGVAARHQRFVVIDVHSYNHRRDGPAGDTTAQDMAPDINIGTFSMPREKWTLLLDPLIDEMRAFEFNGRRLDVRENIAFQGKGEQTRFIHDRYPGKACAIALEFKKFFMDEWTGEPDPAELDAMRRLIAHIAQRAEALLGQ